MSRSRRRGKFVRNLKCMAVAGLLAAAARPAAAEEVGFHPIDSLLRTMDLKTDVGPAPDFVEASRPKVEPGFLPVGAPHPQGTVKVKSPAELKAATAALDAARMQHDRLAGRKQPELKDGAGKSTAAAKTAVPRTATQN